MVLLKSKNIVASGMIAFLAVSFWVLYSMPMGQDGGMFSCPFMQDFSSFCQMTLNEHISQWQRMFALTPKESFFSFFLLLTLTFYALSFIIDRSLKKLKHCQPFFHFLCQHNPEIKLFNILTIAFSKGIIHPKIYA